MALTNVQNEFLKLQLQNNPEFMAEYFPNVITEGPTGPLYDVDYAGSKPANVFYDEGAEFRNINVPYETEGSRINIKATPANKFLTSELIPWRNPEYTDYAYMKPRELYHEGKPITGGQTQAINMNPNILASYGTEPSSPRNQMANTPEWWAKAGKDFGFETGPTVDQATLNDFIESVLVHEVGHGVSGKPDYTGLSEGATSLDFSEFLSPNVKQAKAWREGEWGGHSQEELYNRMKDIERLKIENPDIYEDHPLWDLYQDRAKMYFAMLTGQDPTTRNDLYKFDAYKKKIKPYVDKYFEKGRDKIGGITDINIKKRAIGMPEHLTPPSKKTYTPPPRGGGADVMPVQKTITPRHAPHPDRGGARDYGKTETRASSGWESSPFAKGGLIDIPLPGRRRDI